ncbi:MAG: Ig-like domain-containing protein [Limisphaerales bacterium]
MAITFMGWPRASGTSGAVRLALALFGALLCPPGNSAAATITNYMSTGWPQSWFNVNVGDTVVWVNGEFSPNYVQSYGGEFKSPSLAPGDLFSFTFTNAGFYAYQTGTADLGPSTLAGVVIANGWTGAPPAVTVLTPLEGSILRNGPDLVQAWATNIENIAQIQYFLGTNLIGIGAATSSYPYGVEYPLAGRSLSAGTYPLVARAVDNQGMAASSKPVNITIGMPTRGGGVWGARRLPTGEFLLFYDAAIVGNVMAVKAADDLALDNPVILQYVNHPGVFVDASVRGGAVPRRFYFLTLFR